jgi:membrane protease YdiL (CAAX protease family)
MRIAEAGQPLLRNPKRVFHWATGFLLAGSILALMNWLMLLTDWFAFKHPVDWFPALARAFSAAVVFSILSEWLFRGVLLGILLRSLRPGLAILGISLLYACLHFLFPMDRLHISDPGNADAGFRFILKMATHLASYLGDALGFITLIFSGLILSYTRYRTASLSLSIGLQTGWLFVLFLSHDIIAFSNANLGKLEAVIGTDRRSGFVPLLFLVATGLLVHVFIQISGRKAQHASH